MDCQEYREIISAFIDGELTTEERLEAQAHLDQCSMCQQTLAWETKAISLLRQNLSPHRVRHELKQRVFDRLGEADHKSLSWFGSPRAWAPALTMVLIMGSVYLLSPLRNQVDLFADTVARYQQANERLEPFSHSAGSEPAARTLDLKPWGYRLIGKSVHRLEDGSKRVFVYHGRQNDLLLAQEFDGAGLLPSRGSTVVSKAGKNFITVSRGNINLVAWEDKNITCVLASMLAPDRIIALAAEIAQRG